MDDKALLRFNTGPVIRMYQQNAFPLGIIQANSKEDITPFLCGKFINCYFDKNEYNQFKHCIQDYWFVGEGILKFQSISLLPDMYPYISLDHIDLIGRMIMNGYYVHGTYNEEHIPNKSAYGKHYENHNYLIIGYDNDKQEFVSVGYIKNGAFSVFNIPYSNMRKALDTLGYEELKFDFYKFNEKYEIKLHLKEVYKELKDYINSVPPENYSPKRKKFGINAIESTADCWIETAKAESWIDARYTRGLMEHKYLMHKRTSYLSEAGIIDAKFISTAQKTYELSVTVHMLGLKYSIKGQFSDVEKMKEKVALIVQTEKEYIPEMIHLV